ncbi:hypothetical protein [Nocardia sienata]|uniref:hypothetical protein n=1 Tax=Nocardia sienata TaxID=248552 RepID=UPI0007A50594|nr:hypothetical protein [Nocardia sienata]
MESDPHSANSPPAIPPTPAVPYCVTRSSGVACHWPTISLAATPAAASNSTTYNKLKELRGRITTVTPLLTQKLGNTPTARDLATALDTEIEEIARH